MASFRKREVFQRVMRKQGWTEKQVTQKYNIFRKKLENFNNLTGAKYRLNASFNYAFGTNLAKGNTTINKILQMTSREISINSVKQSKSYLGYRYGGLIRRSETVAKEFRKIGTIINGKEYTPRDFDTFARSYLKKLKARRIKDPLVNS